MIKLLSFLFLMMLSSFAFSQVESEETLFNFQIAYCVGSSNSTAWIGDEVVVMIEGELPSDRDNSIMEQVVNIFADIISKYEELTGLEDLPLASSYNNKPVIEIVIDNCGAGGLASHGVLGMSTGIALFNEFYDLVLQGDISVPQVFLYELNRNFWEAGMDGFNGKFDWAMNDEPQNYGWWTVGMNNAQAYIIPKSLNIGLDYFGSDLNYWEDRMVNELEDYMSDNQYDFDNGWKQSLMPWHNTESINDLMSGLIIYSYNNFGGEDWIKGFYKHIQNDEIIDRSGVFAYQECRDNIYKIWSYAANQDLRSFFENELRWVISDESKNCVSDFFEISYVTDHHFNESVILYPNPVANVLTIENNGIDQSLVQIYNESGELIKEESLSEITTYVNMSELSQGIYYVRVSEELFIIIK